MLASLAFDSGPAVAKLLTACTAGTSCNVKIAGTNLKVIALAGNPLTLKAVLDYWSTHKAYMRPDYRLFA